MTELPESQPVWGLLGTLPYRLYQQAREAGRTPRETERWVSTVPSSQSPKSTACGAGGSPPCFVDFFRAFHSAPRNAEAPPAPRTPPFRRRRVSPGIFPAHRITSPEDDFACLSLRDRAANSNPSPLEGEGRLASKASERDEGAVSTLGLLSPLEGESGLARSASRERGIAPKHTPHPGRAVPARLGPLPQGEREITEPAATTSYTRTRCRFSRRSIRRKPCTITNDKRR